MDLTFGIDVSPVAAKITATADAPASGNFAGEAVFQLQLGSAAPVEVRLLGNGNSSTDDLIADLNAALTAAGLAVKAQRDGNKIQLRTTQVSATPTLRITASAGNPAVTALHLPTSADAFDNPVNHVFIRNQAIAADLIIGGTLAANATLGFVGITGGMRAGGELDFTFAPLGGQRVGLLDLYQTLTTNIAALGTPVITGSSYFNVDNIAVNASGLNLGLPAITPQLPGMNDPHQISVTIPNYRGALPQFALNPSLLAGLSKLSELSFDDVLSALQELADRLVEMGKAELLGVRIPGLGLSAGELVGFADDFLELVQELRANPAGALEGVEAAIEAKLAQIVPGALHAPT